MSAADRVRTGLAEPEVSDLALGDQLAVAINMPLVPLRRYRLLMGESSFVSTGPTIVSSQEMVELERTPLVLGEVLFTYLTWWVLGPVALIREPGSFPGPHADPAAHGVTCAHVRRK
ncbi:hypothetical protein [Catenuloplanes japonicus]|uniref:hypothetical protein n=1 Tax=Catenuloplanes japonicus TaxID=33876 RepID=UPI001E5636FD|nr:hypothetical protein [Catenuloplanes japonicus]